MPYTDDQIRSAVMKIFKKYDKNGSGYLEGKELQDVYRDLMDELLFKKGMSREQAASELQKLDKNQDARVTLDEMYVLMRTLNP